MSRYFKRWVQRQPLEVFLCFFNSGIFVWLMVTTRMMLSRIGFHNLAILDAIPSWILRMGNQSLLPIRALVSQLPWFWFFFSFLLTIIAHFVKGVIRTILIVVIVILGLYLLYKNWHLLQWVNQL